MKLLKPTLGDLGKRAHIEREAVDAILRRREEALKEMLVEAKTREWDTEHSRQAWVVRRVMEIRKIDHSAATTLYEEVLKDRLHALGRLR